MKITELYFTRFDTFQFKIEFTKQQIKDAILTQGEREFIKSQIKSNSDKLKMLSLIEKGVRLRKERDFYNESKN